MYGIICFTARRHQGYLVANRRLAAEYERSRAELAITGIYQVISINIIIIQIANKG